MAKPTTPHSLETVTGKFVDLLNPDPNDICIEDIAWSLSRLARFNGHTVQKLPYSVGQHSIVVAKEAGYILRDTAPDSSITDISLIRIKALLHDATEAYTGDISGPLKKIPELRPIIKKIENNIETAVFEGLNISPMTTTEHVIIKQADVLAQRIEAYNFMVSRGMNWLNMPDVSIEKLQEFEMPASPLDVYHDFLTTYNDLKKII